VFSKRKKEKEKEKQRAEGYVEIELLMERKTRHVVGSRVVK
jgi:hypothetical protein